MYVRGYLQGSENGRVVTIDECIAPQTVGNIQIRQSHPETHIINQTRNITPSNKGNRPDRHTDKK